MGNPKRLIVTLELLGCFSPGTWRVNLKGYLDYYGLLRVIRVHIQCAESGLSYPFFTFRKKK